MAKSDTAKSSRGRLWWFWRFLRAYRKHGVRRYGLRKTWSDAMYARRAMEPAEQWNLRPIRSER